MTISELMDKAAAELVEELLEVSATPNGEPWFFVIRRKLAALANDLKKRKKPTKADRTAAALRFAMDNDQ